MRSRCHLPAYSWTDTSTPSAARRATRESVSVARRDRRIIGTREGAATYILAFASWRLILALPIQRPSSPLSPVEGELQAAEAGVRGQACSTSDSSTKPRAQTSLATEGDGGGSLDAASDSGKRVE